MTPAPVEGSPGPGPSPPHPLLEARASNSAPVRRNAARGVKAGTGDPDWRRPILQFMRVEKRYARIAAGASDCTEYHKQERPCYGLPDLFGTCLLTQVSAPSTRTR